MSRPRWLALLATVFVACGIDAAGTLAPNVDGGQDAAPPPAPAPPPEGPSDAEEDAGSDTGVDASDAEAGPKCGSVTFSDPLTTLDTGADGGWVVVRDSSNGTYPQIDTSPEGPAVSLVGFGGSVGGIWRSPQPLEAFDVSFRYLVSCPAGTCSDGLSAIWIEATDAGSGELYPALSGAGLGIPGAHDGGALVLDIFKDPGPNDPDVPSFSILAIDATKTSNNYDWHTKSGAADAGLFGAHDVAIHVRKGTLTATLDGAPLVSGSVATDFTGWLGLLGASGGTPGVFYVRNFAARFYVCDDP
ncbi:MAG TPA: hypothetical protein VIF62_09785 [Labilithrix sp.]|jgi:hypothetical protein